MSNENTSFYKDHYWNTDTTEAKQPDPGQEPPADEAFGAFQDEPIGEAGTEPIREKRRTSPLKVILIVAGIVGMMILCGSCLIGLFFIKRLYDLGNTVTQIGYTSTYPVMILTPTPPPTPTPSLHPGRVILNEEHFPDENFRNYVIKLADLNGNGVLETSERETVRTIKVPGSGILSLKGIEYFSELEALNCSDNGLGELSVEQNTKLKALDCSGNMIYGLDLDSNTAMEYLVVDENVDVVHAASNVNVMTKKIDAQDVTASLKLVRIIEANFPDSAFRTYLRYRFDPDENYVLDEEELKEVTEILIRNRGINSVEGIGYFKDLEYLDCSENPLLSVDVSYNPKLAYVFADPGMEVKGAGEGAETLHSGEISILHQGEISSDDVMIDETNFPDETFRELIRGRLDLDGSGALNRWERNTVIELDVSGNEIKSLVGIEHFPHLNDLDCSNNDLTSLDLSGNSELSFLDCTYNDLTSLDVSGTLELCYLDCAYNGITSLDVSNNPELSELSVDFGVEVIGAEKLPIHWGTHKPDQN